MPWVRLDDGFPDHPKVSVAGPMASWLYVCGLAYCARHLTDGLIPEAQLRKLVVSGTVVKLAERLVEADLWERAAGGFRVHDYLQYNPTRQQTLDLRKQKASAGAAGGKQNASRVLAARLSSAIAPVPIPSRTVNQEEANASPEPPAARPVRAVPKSEQGVPAPHRQMIAALGRSLGEPKTKGDWGKYATAAADLVRGGALPDDVPWLVNRWDELYAGATCTVTALSNNYASLTNENRRPKANGNLRENLGGLLAARNRLMEGTTG